VIKLIKVNFHRR